MDSGTDTPQGQSHVSHMVLRLMEQFPDYHFTQSQPQLYEFVRQDDPALFSDIQRRVAEGRWEPIGGMWVEADCNLSGAEALVRQLLLGISFFRQHFGPHAMSPVLWLPDVFGYAGTCRSSSSRPDSTTSLPSSWAGISITACRTTRSGGRVSTARVCSPTSAPVLIWGTQHGRAHTTPR